MAQNIDFNKLVPGTLKNEMLDSLVKNLFNRFVSQEDSVLVSGRIGTPVEGDSDIKQPNLERQENELVPGLTFSAGKERFVFTFDDLVNKMEVLGIDVASLRGWMAEQTFNYSPPIDYDRFINYANYYWTGKAINDAAPVWSPDNSPEYYVIERPRPNDLVKMPVRLATTRNINRQINDRPTETLTIEFTSTTTFGVTSDIDPNVFGSVGSISPTPGDQTLVVVKTNDTGTAPSLDAPGLPDYDLVQLYIIGGTMPFAAGDQIVIEITYYTSNIYISVVSPNLIGKGTASGVATLSPFMYIDGEQVEIGDRILVKDQTDASENGIYTVVRGSQWVRTFDAVSVDNLQDGVKVYVNGGATLAGNTYTLTNTANAGIPPYDFPTDLNFALTSTTDPSPVNEWQIYNYWVHKDDIYQYANLGVTLGNVQQANRPIIEYNNRLHLNSAIDGAGGPAEPGVGHIDVQQVKTRFNQIPQFDLYRYDGTHAGATSGIWYFLEDPNFETDAVLQRRVAITANSDYIFGCAATDDAGRLYYYKVDGELQSIWAPGPDVTATSTPLFVGVSVDSAGTVVFNSLGATADNQHWTVRFSSATSAEVIGSRSGSVGTLTVGTAFTCDDFNVTISAGVDPYADGDVFTFNVYNKLAPRYIKEDVDGSIINYPGGYAADQALTEPVGAWLTPSRMFQNMFRETREEIAFGDFLTHARSVLKWQDGFTGSSFGNNNSRTLDFDPGLGGQIREFGSNFPLLASMLIEQDISPLTILTFAEQQYNVALSSIDQFIIDEVPGYLSAIGQIETTVINASAPDILALEAYFEKLRGEDVNLSGIYSDSTSLVENWPATLPMIGLLPKVQPDIVLDNEMNAYVIRHHDGHVSTLAAFDQVMNTKLAKTVVKRSDGNTTPGFFLSTTPAYPTNTPYASQLWFKTTDGTLMVFNVRYDAEPLSPLDGETWYKRDVNQVWIWDATFNTWSPSVNPPSSYWIPFTPENVRNSLVLAVEQKLYNSVHPAQQINLDMATDVNASPQAGTYAEIELATFAAKYNYDIYGPDYDAANAFTWNYSQAVPTLSDFPGFVTVPARWNKILEEYFGAQVNTISTDRPDLFPWRLGTAACPAVDSDVAPTSPIDWNATYKNTIAATSNAVAAKVVSIADVPTPLMGLITIDGYVLQAGDRVLLLGQLLPEQNGLYVAAAGGWSRTADPIVTGLTVNVSAGASQAGTTWVLTTIGAITVNITPLTFDQSRIWSNQMWADIKVYNPGVRLSVNTVTDALLAPYVASAIQPGYTLPPAQAVEALTSTIPAGTNLGYQFGDDGPVELVWTKSLEYNYGIARTYFKLFPLKFLDASWGETYVSTGDNLRIERNLATSLSSKKFLLHGERLNIINSYRPQLKAQFDQYVLDGDIVWGADFGGVVEFKVTHVASTGQVGPLPTFANLGPSATVFNIIIDGVPTNTYVYEGVPFTFTYGTAPDDVAFTSITIDDFGIPFELNDVITIGFSPDTITTEIPTIGTDFVYGLLGCEGCVADATPDPSTIITIIPGAAAFGFTAGQVKVFKGTGQWFTNLMRYSTVDTNASTSALAYRGWDIRLVHRLGALIRPETLNIIAAAGKMPTTGYSMLLKRSEKTKSLWISGLRVQVVQMGAKILNPGGLYVPKNDASDWIFRLEVYNPYHPLIEYNIFGGDPTLNQPAVGTFTTFNVLDQRTTSLVWKRYNQPTATETSTMPVQIIGLQNLLNLIYGYVGQLEEQGFLTNTGKALIDKATGRAVDWQLEVEKLINTIYTGVNAGSGIIVNPFMEKLFLDTPIGLMSRYTETKFIDHSSAQACYDVIGSVIPVNKLSVIRTDPNTITYSKTPIFSAHVFIDEYEHAILFNDHFSGDPTSAAIFDQFLGSYMNTAALSFNRQNRVDGKPTFDGFFLNDDNIIRNPTSNVDALARAYDAGQTFNEPKMAEHALALIGYKSKDYFNNINISDQTQLDFWRGMIGAKGTNLTIDAFTNYKEFLNSSVDEFWAYKLATYGDDRERSFPEVKIEPNDCTRQFTGIQFNSTEYPQSALPLYMQVAEYDDTRWFSIDDLGTMLRFDADALTETVVVSADDFAASPYVILQNIFHTGDAAPITSGGSSLVAANILEVPSAGTYTVTGFTWINPTKLSPIKLFDYSTDTLVTQVSLWHPAIGIHEPTALELVNIRSSGDPAHYSYTTLTTDNPNYLALKPWNEQEVGRVWWDTSTLAYTPYYDALTFPNRETRHNRWGSLAEYASVDLYQWTASDYHPSEYNEAAAEQEGDSSIDQSVRLSGEVGFTNYYRAERSITIKPIAWSQTSSSNGLAHPAFGPATFVKVFNSNNRLVVDTGRLASINIVTGYNFGGWSDDGITQKPVGEVVIGTDVIYDVGSSVSPAAPVVLSNDVTIDDIEVTGIDDSIAFGTRIGQISIAGVETSPFVPAIPYDDNGTPGDPSDDTLAVDAVPATYVARLTDQNGFFQDLPLSDWSSADLSTNSKIVLAFDKFGLQLTLTRAGVGIVTAQELANSLNGTANDVFVREAVDYTSIVALPDVMFSNNASDSPNYGWKVWQIPTQAQLRADLAYPNNKWQPYIGDSSTVLITADVAAAMNSSANTWNLVNGITINRYTSAWSEWVKLQNTSKTIVSDSLTAPTFTFENETELDANRLSIYANGIQIAPAQIVISDNTATAVNTQPEGTLMYALYRPYQPTASDLAFDPTVEDDFQVQTWYKVDYQYTERVIRNSAGNISGKKYYFWVKNKTVPETNKSMSLEQAADLLRYGSSTYMIFSRLVTDTNAESGTAYDSCAISGLTRLITKTGSYKLRFLRDFTLRDDPEELKLKNVHTEWKLIRQHMSDKIPAQLWALLTNSVCAQDVAGNPLPSTTRINYDEKYGTNTRFGFESDQIFVDSTLAINSIVNTILNTSLTITIGNISIVDYITALNISSSTTEDQLKAMWFSTPAQSRATMNLIYSTSRASQINEIFFSVLSDALANNYEFTDLFKTSLITVNSTTIVKAQTSGEQSDEFY